MPRSNWKGVISFGLVSIPIVLFNSEDTSEKMLFHQIDKRNNARIKYKRINEKTGKEVEWDNIIKGYAYDKDIVLPVGEGELEKISGGNARTIEIDSFVNKDSIDFIDVSKTYYIIPDKKGEKGYVILRESLKKSHVIGIAKVIISTKEYLAAVSCYQEALVLYLLRYQEAVHPLFEFDIPRNNLKDYKVASKEVDVAVQLIKSMTTQWHPENYQDEYQEAVHQWADKKIKHKKPIAMRQRGKEEKASQHVDFIDLLRKSLETTKKKPHAKKAIPRVYKRKPHSARKSPLH